MDGEPVHRVVCPSSRDTRMGLGLLYVGSVQRHLPTLDVLGEELYQDGRALEEDLRWTATG